MNPVMNTPRSVSSSISPKKKYVPEYPENDGSLSTIVLMGMIGSGKSTLANILHLKDDEKKTHNRLSIGTGEEPHTKNVHLSYLETTAITQGRSVRIVDTPGLPSNIFEQKPILNEIKDKINELGHVKMFVIVLTNSTRLSAFFDTLDHILDSLSNEVTASDFWEHACIVITHFSSNPEYLEELK
jgi:predicted GTPase